MVMENRPVDPGSIQGSHRPISFIRINIEHARTIFCVKLSINNHIVGLVHKNHGIRRTRLMYHAAFKVEFQPFKRLYSHTADVFQLFIKCIAHDRSYMFHYDSIVSSRAVHGQLIDSHCSSWSTSAGQGRWSPDLGHVAG